MKEFKCVRARADETNYKKGTNRLDVNSGGYKAGKIGYNIAFAWFMVFQFAYLFGTTISYGTRGSQNVVIPLYIGMWCTFAGVLLGFIFLKKRWHVASFSLSLVSCVAEMILFYRLTDEVPLAFLEGGFMNNRYFWFHFAPCYMLLALLAFVCFVGVKTWVHGRKDYNEAMAAMYLNYQEEHPEVSDIEWQQHLKELDEQMKNDEKEDKKQMKRKK